MAKHEREKDREREGGREGEREKEREIQVNTVPVWNWVVAV